MSDSAKLRFVYGIISLICAFLCFGLCISIIFLLIFLNIDGVFIIIPTFGLPGFFILACTSVHYFRHSGIIQDQDMKAKGNNRP